MRKKWDSSVETVETLTAHPPVGYPEIIHNGELMATKSNETSPGTESSHDAYTLWNVPPEAMAEADRIMSQLTIRTGRRASRRATRRDWHSIKGLRAMFKHHPEMTASHASSVTGHSLDYCRRLLVQLEKNGELESESKFQRNGKCCLVYSLKHSNI